MTNWFFEIAGGEMGSATLTSSFGESRWLVKRSTDVVLSVAGLIVSAPLMMAISIAIKLTSPGPVIFKQQRVGLNGNIFTICKFRTMPVGSEASGFFTYYHDKRITLVGKLLRPFHFDEIPQLWNILKGDMSLVGPRPHPIDVCVGIASHVPDFHKRHQVMPGLTGLAQVNLGHEISDEIERQCFEWDMRYIATCSFLTDLKILLKTVVVVIARNGN